MAEGAVVGAAVGATAGAIAAGAHGAIIGAAAGGVFGGGAGLITDRDLRLNKGQQLELRLDRPLQVPR
jgi:outer membrane lipoprotein SlyB